MNSHHFSTYRQIEFAQIAIDSTQVSGRGGSLAPRLQLPAKLALSPLRGQQLGFLIQELTGDVVIGHAGGFVTRLVPSTIQKVVIGTGCDHHLNLVLPIEHHQLEAIEQTRNCGDVALHLQLTLTYLVLAQPTPSTTTDMPVQVLVDGGVATASVDVKIPQSIWAKEVLRGTAFGELLIFEMPAFPVSSLANEGASLDLLDDGEVHFSARLAEILSRLPVNVSIEVGGVVAVSPPCPSQSQPDQARMTFLALGVQQLDLLRFLLRLDRHERVRGYADLHQQASPNIRETHLVSDCHLGNHTLGTVGNSQRYSQEDRQPRLSLAMLLAHLRV